LSASIHLPPIENSKLLKPVMLPSGRARLVTKPMVTGSPTCVKTIGMPRVYCRSATADEFVAARSTSGLSSISSFAKGAMCVASPPPQR
jgi:hypothetical protein